LRSVSAVFRVTPSDGEEQLHIPFWALDPVEVLSFLMGKLDDMPLTQILDRIFDYKLKRVEATPIPGIDITSMMVDSPIPFRLHKLWFELLEPEIKTWSDKERTIPALIEPADAQTLKLPRYKLHSTTNTAPYMNNIGVWEFVAH